MESAKSAVPGVDRNDLHPYRIAVPPLCEQRAIADYLDRKAAAIDTLIAKKERLIELLQEKRQALITRAVTKGLVPNVPMKDSGIEWLGEIPAHWEVKRGRFIFRQLSLPPNGTVGVVTAFRDGQVTLRENRRAEGYTFAIKELGYQGVRSGDLVIQSMDAFAGAIGVSDSFGRCSPEYVVLEPVVPTWCNRYFAACLRRMALHDYVYVICPSVRERAPRFRFETLKDVLLPCPPPIEQHRIADFLDSIPASLSPLIRKLGEQLAFIREYRQALISAAVTGKINIPAEDAL